MAAFSKNTAAVILCRRNGTILQVLYDDLALPTCERLELLSASFDRRRAKRFFEALDGKKAILDRKLTVTTTAGPVPVYFSGATSGPTVVIIVTRHRFEAGQFPPNLDPASAEHLRRMRIAFQKLKTLKQVRADSTDTAPGMRHIGTADLLRLIAHDVTNPMSGVLAASQYLLEDEARVLDPQQRMLLRLIETASEYVVRFVESIVELQIIRSGKLRVHLQPFNLGRVVEDVISSYRRRAEGKRVRLELRTEGPVPIVDLDHQRLTQALAAVVRNELECRPPGGTIRITLAEQGTAAAITIARQQEGPKGQPAPAAAKPISRAPKRGLNEIRTAFTLSAVSQIVEAHRGQIRQEERLGEDPAFIITLPLAARRTRKRKASLQEAGGAQPI